LGCCEAPTEQDLFLMRQEVVLKLRERFAVELPKRTRSCA
jgi:hypothetical protein